MKLRTVLVANSVVALLFGLGFLIFPAQVLSVYGLTTDTAGLLVGRFFGAALLGYAVLSWLFRDVGDPEARRAIVLTQFIQFGAGLVVAFVGWTATPKFNWLNVLIYGAFAAAYGYFQFSTPTWMPAPQPPPKPAAMPLPPVRAAAAPARKAPARRAAAKKRRK
mgnify:CR=1 FL=1